MSMIRILVAWLLLCAQPFALAQAPAAAAAPAAAGDYVLGAGDRIRVTVFQSPELSIETRVPAGGAVSYPLLGEVALGGLSVPQAERRIAEALVQAHLVREPQVSIAVTEIHASQASVLGLAVHPGRFPLDSPGMHLSELMAQAGGIAPEASELITVTGMRDGARMHMTVDFRRLSTGTDPEHDILIRPDDIVYVARAPQVYVYGEVQHPGPLRLEPGMRVLQALAAAGGPTLRGTRRGIRVSRPGPDGRLVDSTPGLQEVLQPEDVVYVPESLF